MRALFASLAALCLLAIAVPTTAVAASCAPDSSTLIDPSTDGKYLAAPEIASVTASVDAACTLTLTDEIANRPGGLRSAVDRLYWWLDVDNNPATGRPSGYMAGAEYGLILSTDGVQLVDGLGATIATLPAAGQFAASVSASMIGATDTSAIRIIAYAQNAPAGQVFTDPPGYAGNYFDYAPGRGEAPFVFRLRPAAAAPPTAPTAPPSAPSVPVVQCVVPTLKGLTLAAARTKLDAAHCAVGAVHRRRATGRAGIVLSSSPIAGATAPSGTKVAVTVRARPRSAR